MTIMFRVLPDCPPNVVYRYDDNGLSVPESAFDNIRLTAPLTDVIQPLARRHPDWRFETRHSHARNFKVSKDNEVLGEISTTYRNYSTITKISNIRIRSEISKGDGMASKDPAKVRKLVEKYFVPRTEDERVRGKHSSLMEQINTIEYTARQTSRTREAAVVPRLFPVLLQQHGDAVLSVAASLGISGVEELRAAYEKLALVQSLYPTARKDVVGVILDKGKYWVTQGPVATPTGMLPFTDDTLPLQLRTNIGLLKLAADGAVYEDVGMRCGPGLFLTVYNPEG
jgi:hypothetical protein